MQTAKRRRPLYLLGLLTALLAHWPVAASAQPEGAIISLHYSETREGRVVVAASQRGVVLIGEDLGNFRAFRATALSGGRPFYWIADVDNDRHNEFVFAGNPSFVLDHLGEPLFGVLQGCDDFYAGDFLGDAMWELFCRRGSTLTVWNYDGQFLWEYSVRGMRLGTCEADDIDSDGRLEFVCEAGNRFLLVDLGNEDPLQEVSENRAQPDANDPRDRWLAEARDAFAGERTFDLNGNGRREETLLLNGSTLVLRDASGATLGSAELGTSEVYSVAVGDLNNDRSPEVFVGGVDVIWVISSTGQILSRVEGNPNRLARDSRVTIESVSANGLEDSSPEAARSVVDRGLSGLQRCYDRQMGSDQFIRVGSMFYELTVDDRGRVTRSQKIHSGVRNEDLEQCVVNTLRDMRFPAAANGNGSVSVRLGFDFVDR
jgi:hypothetical protein